MTESNSETSNVNSNLSAVELVASLEGPIAAARSLLKKLSEELDLFSGSFPVYVDPNIPVRAESLVELNTEAFNGIEINLSAMKALAILADAEHAAFEKGPSQRDPYLFELVTRVKRGLQHTSANIEAMTKLLKSIPHP